MFRVGWEVRKSFLHRSKAACAALCVSSSWGKPSTHDETAATEAAMLILLAATGLAVASSTSLSSLSSAFKSSLR